MLSLENFLSLYWRRYLGPCIYLFIIYFSFFNVDTFSSSNTLLIKIDSKLQNFITLQVVKRFIKTRLINITHTRNKSFYVSCSDKFKFPYLLY